MAYLALYADRIPLYQSPLVDAKIYDQWARTIAGGDLWSAGEGAFYRAPLYPYLLASVYAVFGSAMPWMALLQIGMGLATMALAGGVAAKIGGERARLWTLILLALYGPMMAAESKLLTTSLGLLLHVASLVLTVRLAERPGWRRGVLAGSVLGLSALVRPQWLLLGLLLPVVLGIFSRSSARGFRAWIPFWLGLVLVLAPVTLRNRWVGKDWVLISSNGGMTLFQGNNEENRSGLLTVVKKFDLFGSATEQRSLETRVAENALGRPLKASETSAFWTRQALDFVLGRPFDWLGLELRKLYRILTSYEYADNYSYYIERQRIWPLWLAPLPFGALLALGLAGTILIAQRGLFFRAALLSAGFGLGMCLVFYVSSRYRMEAIPALAILGGAGLARAMEPGVARGRLFRGASLGALLLFAASWLPAGAPARSQESITYLQLGNALESQGRTEEALAAYQNSVELLPENVFAWTNRMLLLARAENADSAYALARAIPPDVAGHPVVLYARGYLESRLGREEAAIASLEAAVRANPLMKEAHSNLAFLYEKQRDYDRAATELEEALRLSGEDPNLLSHLAYVRLQQRRYEEARIVCRRLLALRPEDPDATFNLAVASFYLGDLDEAEARLEEDALGLYYRGLIRLRRGDAPGAILDLERAFVERPSDRRTLYYLSLARARVAGIESWNGWPVAWEEAYGPAFRPAAGAIADWLRVRSRNPWGGPLSAAEQHAWDSLAGRPELGEFLQDLERMLAEEGPRP